MDIALWFKMFLFLVVTGFVLSLIGGAALPAAPNIGTLSIFNSSAIPQIPLMNTNTSPMCTASSSNTSQTCYYDGGGGFVNGSYCDSNPVPGCHVTCYNNNSFIDFSGIVHSLWCFAQGFFWIGAIIINFFIMIANFIVWGINLIIRFIAIIIALSGYIASLALFFTGIAALFNTPLIPGGLGIILGMVVAFMWAFLIFEFITSFRGMFLPK